MSHLHRELELKAVVPDHEAFRRRLMAAGALPGFSGRMIDVRYDRAGELTLRDEVLRVRTFRAADGAVESVVAWKGPTGRSAEGYKLREEIEVPVGADPARLLQALGYGPTHVIEREIEVWRLGVTSARIEHYPRMDVLVEVEGTPEGIERVIALSGIPRSEFTAESLVEFVRRYEARTGTLAELARSTPTGAGL